MPRLFLLVVTLTTLLAASGSVSVEGSHAAPAASKSADPFNIGFVLYTKGNAPGTLNARWNYANAYSGRGLATGGPAAGGFVGRYHVRYYLEDGQFSDEYDLDIQKHDGGDFYDVTWVANGKVGAKGVGMEVPKGGGLAVGWRRVAD